MSAKVSSYGGGSLSYPAALNLKPALVSGEEWWCGMWVRMPSSWGTAVTQIGGYDSDNNASYTNVAGEAGLSITANTDKRLRFAIRGSSATDGWAATGLTGGTTTWSTMNALTDSTDYLILWGFRENSAGDWRLWRAVCKKNTAVDSTNDVQVGTSASTSGTNTVPYTLATNTHVIRNKIWSDVGSTTGKSGGLSFEHIAHIKGAFPWDTGTGKPDASVITGLANGTYRYDSPPSGSSWTILDWRKLLTASDVTNYGTNGAGSLTTNGVVSDDTAIAPWSFAPVLTEHPANFVFAGRSSGTLTWSGTYTGTAPGAIKARITSGGTAVTSFDWQTVVASPSGGTFTFSFSNVPVGGPYRIDVRWGDDTSTQALGARDFYCGSVVWIWGQSQADRLSSQGAGTLAPTAGMKCSYLYPSQKTNMATASENLVKPAAAGDLGSGIMSIMNQWWADTSEPLMLVECNYGGTNISNWINNDVVSGSAPMWGNGSDPTTGIATWAAYHARNQADAVVFMQGTADVAGVSLPGAVTSPLTQTYATNMDSLYTLFDALISTPFKVFVLPHHRSSDDSTLTNNKTWSLRNIQYQKALSGDPYRLLCHMPDIQNDGNGSAHPDAVAFNSGLYGNIRVGKYMGRGMAALLVNSSLDRLGPAPTTAMFTDGTKTAFDVTFSGTIFTRDSSTTNIPQCYVSTDSFAQTSSWPSNYDETSGFSVAIVASNKIRVTKSSGAWTGNPKFDYCRSVPWDTEPGGWSGTTESAIMTNLDKMLYGVSSFYGGAGLPVLPTMGTGLTVLDYVAPGSVPVRGALGLGLTLGL